MKPLRPGIDVPGFFHRLTAAPHAALLLDYDGTLAPFRAARNDAVPYPGVRPRLDAIAASGRTRLVVISGRPLDEVRALLDLARPIELWGAHGWERLRPGREPQNFQPPSGAVRGLDDVLDWAARARLTDRCERKTASLAFHWRGLDEPAADELRARISDALAPIARDAGLELRPFDGGIEFRAPGRDKSTAVRAVLDDLPPDAPTAFLGDDLTDEDGFTALAGRGLSVLVRAEWRPTAADLWLTPPEELLQFLDQWRSATEAAP